jgi:hypothetical protein
VFFTLALGAGIAGTVLLEQGLAPTDAVPTSSYLVGYYNSLSEWFPNVGPPIYVIFGEDVRFEEWETQVGIISLLLFLLLKAALFRTELLLLLRI